MNVGRSIIGLTFKQKIKRMNKKVKKDNNHMQVLLSKNYLAKKDRTKTESIVEPLPLIIDAKAEEIEDGKKKGNVFGTVVVYEKKHKRTSIGGGRVKTSSMNKNKKRSYKKYNQQGR